MFIQTVGVHACYVESSGFLEWEMNACELSSWLYGQFSMTLFCVVLRDFSRIFTGIHRSSFENDSDSVGVSETLTPNCIMPGRKAFPILRCVRPLILRVERRVGKQPHGTSSRA